MRMKKMPKKQIKSKTKNVHIILDETGSMSVCKTATINGFNEYITNLKKEKDINVTLTTFNSNKINIVYKNKNIGGVPILTDKTYNPDFNTPLYDAVGKTIREIEDAKNKENLIVVITDGEENASKEYTRQMIFDKIKEKEKLGWTFVFMGANQDAWAEGYKIGALQGNTMNFNTNNMRATFATLSAGTRTWAKAGGASSKNFFNK